jgi:hypothetical protein
MDPRHGPHESYDRAEDARGEEYLDEQRRDREAERAPLPAVVTPDVDAVVSDAFQAAFARGAAIYEAGDNPRALAAAVGTTQTELIKRAAALQVDAATSYAKQQLSPAAIGLCTVTDALLLGILIGRELPQ